LFGRIIDYFGQRRSIQDFPISKNSFGIGVCCVSYQSAKLNYYSG